MTAAETLAHKFAENRELLEEAEAQKARFKHIVDANPVPTVLITRTGENVYVNNAYASFLGCQPQDLLDFGWKDFIAPDALSALTKVWNVYFTDPGQKWFTASTVFRTKKGQETATVMAVRIPDDGFAAFIVPEHCAPFVKEHCLVCH